MTKRTKRSVSSFVSQNADNRHFCIAIQRQKFCYETKAKAELACKFSKDIQRPYYCEFCCSYHTTHVSKAAYDDSGAKQRDMRIIDRIKNNSKIEQNEVKRLTKIEQIEKIKEELSKENNVLQRFIFCCQIHQIEKQNCIIPFTGEEFEALVRIDGTESKEAIKYVINSGVKTKKRMMLLYILCRMSQPNGMKCDSIKEIIGQYFNETSTKKKKSISNIILKLYNAGIIMTKKNNEGARFYKMKENFNLDELAKIPKDCARYFIPN